MTNSAKNKFWELASSFVMTSLQSNEDCQVNDSKNAFPTDAESSLHLPLDGSMCIVFTGHYNGVGVEIRSPNEMTLLSHMGCFGKGSASRSTPKTVQNNSSPCIMRKRQFLKRNYWYKRFGKHERITESDNFFKDIDNLITKIVHDTKNQVGRDVIDLVSTDDENSESENCNTQTEFDELGKNNIVVLVPNSDSEGDNYFANMKPKCCINKISLQEKLILTLEEAFFLLYGLGCLQVVYNDHHIFNIEECWKAFSQSNSQFIERYVVYHYFRSKGYIVKPGIKFGGDYCKKYYFKIYLKYEKYIFDIHKIKL